MGFIKQLVFLLLIPVVTYGQTAHVDGDRIVYKGTVTLDSLNKARLYAKAKNALLSNIKGTRLAIVTDNEATGMIAAKGSIKFASPYSIIKTVEFILELSVEEGSYQYRIDSVYTKQVERGGKTVKSSSVELLKGMESSGEISAATEKLLNEIDMNFQKLLVLINAGIKKTPEVKNPGE